MPWRPPVHKPKGYVSPKAKKAEADKARGSASSRGYDARWRKARLVYLKQHPLCVQCEANRLVVAANVVDHITPHRGDMELFWDSTNWQALCKRCHDTKTAREDGRWS